MIRIVLIENANLDAHRLRSESRRAGLSLVYECARGRAELERLLARHPRVVVSDVECVGGLPLTSIVELAESAGVPLVLLGGDAAHERTLLTELRGRYAATLRRSHLGWLPVLVERVAREHQEAAATHPGGLRASVAPAGQLDSESDQMRRVQKLALLGRLTASIAHEINNPLEAITNLAYIISTDEQTPEHLKQYLETAEQELARVSQITKQTLSFYREANTPLAVVPSELLEEALVLFGRKLEERQIRVERQYESEEALMLLPGEIRQVFANLVANAIDATSPGGRIVVRVRKARRHLAWAEDALSGVRITIADSGTGIPPEVRARLGEPLYTTKGQDGTGIGLWVSQAIVKRYQGEMQLRSSVAPDLHGTTFSIFLPTSMRPRVVEISPALKPAVGDALPIEGMRLRASSL